MEDGPFQKAFPIEIGDLLIAIFLLEIFSGLAHQVSLTTSSRRVLLKVETLTSQEELCYVCQDPSSESLVAAF